VTTGRFIQGWLGRQVGNNDSRSGLRDDLWNREDAIGLGRGRIEGRQREGESSCGDGRIGLVGSGQSGIAGSVISPLTLVAGAKKLFQDVSEDAWNEITAFPHDANVLTGRALPHGCTTTNGGPDSSSNRTRDSIVQAHNS
jgi:hypothetical protein